MASAQSFVESFIEQLTDIATKAPDAFQGRKELLEAAKDFVLSLEGPEDVIERVCYQVSAHPNTRIGHPVDVLTTMTTNIAFTYLPPTASISAG
jgi:hypothetical protein